MNISYYLIIGIVILISIIVTYHWTKPYWTQKIHYTRFVTVLEPGAHPMMRSAYFVSQIRYNVIRVWIPYYGKIFKVYHDGRDWILPQKVIKKFTRLRAAQSLIVV